MRHGKLLLLALFVIPFLSTPAKAECQDVGTCVAQTCPGSLTCFPQCEANLNSCIQSQEINQAVNPGLATQLNFGAAPTYTFGGAPNGFDNYDFDKYGPAYPAILRQEAVQTAIQEQLYNPYNNNNNPYQYNPYSYQAQQIQQAEETQLLLNYLTTNH